jgi:hypothetical protein
MLLPAKPDADTAGMRIQIFAGSQPDNIVTE